MHTVRAHNVGLYLSHNVLLTLRLQYDIVVFFAYAHNKIVFFSMKIYHHNVTHMNLTVTTM